MYKYNVLFIIMKYFHDLYIKYILMVGTLYA